jgi:hypothetical protein
MIYQLRWLYDISTALATRYSNCIGYTIHQLCWLHDLSTALAIRYINYVGYTIYQLRWLYDISTALAIRYINCVGYTIYQRRWLYDISTALAIRYINCAKKDGVQTGSTYRSNIDKSTNEAVSLQGCCTVPTGAQLPIFRQQYGLPKRR